MNLVVQGEEIETRALKELAGLTRASGIERITGQAFRLNGADPDRQPEVAEYCEARSLDYGFVPADRKLGSFGLFVTDMDSTLISIECIDEIADMQGLKPEVAAITEAAMRGEIDFRESLSRRVSLLAGLPESALERVYVERLRLNPGAEQLLAGLQRAGVRTVLVSGGFTYFTERLRERLGFDHAYANQLEVHDGKLTGHVTGHIVDGFAKRQHLETLRDRYGIAPEAVMAAGDGANDLPMFSAAGVSIAYHAKPVVRSQASYMLNHVGLEGILGLFA